MIETYPGEAYPADVAAVVGSIGLYDRARGGGRHQHIVSHFAAELRARYVDPGSGMLYQMVDARAGRPLGPPRASGTAIAAYFLSFADGELSREVFAGIAARQRADFLGFGGVREYPEGAPGGGDIDSGPVLLGISVSATGFSLAGARLSGEREMFVEISGAGAPPARPGRRMKGGDARAPDATALCGPPRSPRVPPKERRCVVSELVLVMGTQNYSSWSLRPWILLRKLGIPFREIVLHFDTPQFAEIEKYSPSRRVPVLLDGELRVWDSIAICEYASEKAGGRGWPADGAARAHARSVAAEMHAGFPALRRMCPMNARARGRRVASAPELEADLARIDAIWADCRRRYADRGPWLFGEYSAADAMYAPVALRFSTYGLPTRTEDARAYLDFVLADAELGAWIRAAEAETHVVPHEEVGM